MLMRVKSFALSQIATTAKHVGCGYEFEQKFRVNEGDYVKIKDGRPARFFDTPDYKVLGIFPETRHIILMCYRLKTDSYEFIKLNYLHI